MQTRHMSKHMLIVSDNRQHVLWDQRHVSPFRPSRVTTFANGREALEYLQNEAVDVILCDALLADMDGVEFIIRIRRTFPNRSLPVVMVTSENRRNKVLDAISAGCSGYILRPYSNTTFERHLQIAFEMESFGEVDRLQAEEAKDMVAMSEFDDAIEAFEEIVFEEDEAQRYFDMGCTYLVECRYGRAIIAFNRAIKINRLFAEAYKGLADAWKGKGELAKYKEHLQTAMDIHARFDRFEETKKLFVEALKCDSDSPNPFNTLGVSLRRQGDYPGAFHAYQKALELTPSDENVYYNMAKAYYLAGMKREAAEAAASACRLNPGFSEGGKLYATITGRRWEAPDATAPAERREKSVLRDD